MDGPIRFELILPASKTVVLPLDDGPALFVPPPRRESGRGWWWSVVAAIFSVPGDGTDRLYLPAFHRYWPFKGTVIPAVRSGAGLPPAWVNGAPSAEYFMGRRAGPPFIYRRRKQSRCGILFSSASEEFGPHQDLYCVRLSYALPGLCPWPVPLCSLSSCSAGCDRRSVWMLPPFQQLSQYLFLRPLDISSEPCVTWEASWQTPGFSYPAAIMPNFVGSAWIRTRVSRFSFSHVTALLPI